MPDTISDKQRRNLITLAKGLLSDLSDDKLDIEFNMSVFSRNIDNDDILQTPIINDARRTDCGTSGCAVGWAPYFGIKKKWDESWMDFSRRAFIPMRDIVQWEWCFSGDWYYVDNSREGAAKRIIYMLQYGVPVDWYKQMAKEAPLCYTHLDGFCETFLEQNT